MQFQTEAKRFTREKKPKSLTKGARRKPRQTTDTTEVRHRQQTTDWPDWQHSWQPGAADNAWELDKAEVLKKEEDDDEEGEHE